MQHPYVCMHDSEHALGNIRGTVSFCAVVISPPLVYSQHTSWFNHHKEDDHDNESNRTDEQEGKLKTTNLKGTSGNTDELFIRQPLEIIAPLIPSLPSFLLFLFVFIIIHRNRQNNGKGWASLVTRRMGAGQNVDMVEGGGGLGPTLNNTLDITVWALHGVSSPPLVRFQTAAWLRLPSLTSNKFAFMHVILQILLNIYKYTWCVGSILCN